MDLQAPVPSQLPLNPNEIQFLLANPTTTLLTIINLSQITFLECINTKIHKIILVDYILHEIMRVSVLLLDENVQVVVGVWKGSQRFIIHSLSLSLVHFCNRTCNQIWIKAMQVNKETARVFTEVSVVHFPSMHQHVVELIET